VKNVLAIATGLCDGLALGLNARAALVTRGLAEMTRLGIALGGRADTFMGLSGLGDLVLTATGDLSRNRKVGLAAGPGPHAWHRPWTRWATWPKACYCARTVVQRARPPGRRDADRRSAWWHCSTAACAARCRGGPDGPRPGAGRRRPAPPAPACWRAKPPWCAARPGSRPRCGSSTRRCASAWLCGEGERCAADQAVLEVEGAARALLTAERTALNFLQLLSAVATKTALYADAVRGTRARIVDTRKTLPGLRLAQKYAVRTGGGLNHRIGLYDAVLIKENHIAAAGGVAAALRAVAPVADRRRPSSRSRSKRWRNCARRWQAGARMVLLDNMDLPTLREAVRINDAVPATTARPCWRSRAA
jgi:hypothetical protein